VTHASDAADRGPVDPPEESGADPTGPRSAASAGDDAPAHLAGSHVRDDASEDHQLPLWQEMGLLLVVALLLAVVLKAFFLQAFYIPSASMNDTLVENDRIVVEKVSYWGSGSPQRGDVVVFSDPGGWLDAAQEDPATNGFTRALELFGLYPTGGHLVKRVVAVGGDEVKCCDGQGRLTVNGVPLNERSYLASGVKPSLIDFDVKVQPGYVWVQGDNRSDSADSRVHLGDPGGGQVPVSDVVGKVVAVIWPLDHATWLHRPATYGSVR
jgi:signal peptidase I